MRLNARRAAVSTLWFYLDAVQPAVERIRRLLDMLHRLDWQVARQSSHTRQLPRAQKASVQQNSNHASPFCTNTLLWQCRSSSSQTIVQTHSRDMKYLLQCWPKPWIYNNTVQVQQAMSNTIYDVDLQFHIVSHSYSSNEVWVDCYSTFLLTATGAVCRLTNVTSLCM